MADNKYYNPEPIIHDMASILLGLNGFEDKLKEAGYQEDLNNVGQDVYSDIIKLYHDSLYKTLIPKHLRRDREEIFADNFTNLESVVEEHIGQELSKETLKSIKDVEANFEDSFLLNEYVFDLLQVEKGYGEEELQKVLKPFMGPETPREELEKGEGFLDMIYLDSLDNPTGGIGHLLTEKDLENYDIANYQEIETRYGKRKVAVNRKGNVIKLPKQTTDEWYEQDWGKYSKLGEDKAKELGIVDENLGEGLGQAFFQLGESFPSKFPSFLGALGDKRYADAREELYYAEPGVESLWSQQTPERVDALSEDVLQTQGFETAGVDTTYNFPSKKINPKTGKTMIDSLLDLYYKDD